MRRINNLVAGFYTCDTDTPRVKYGGWKHKEANILGDMVRNVATRDYQSWDVYLQQVLFNDVAIWSDNGGLHTKQKMRSFLPDPSFPFIHIPDDDFDVFKSELKH